MLERGDNINSENTLKSGLLMVQIDGLSQEQFIYAVKSKKLPFLKQLMDDKQFNFSGMYSGLPSTTPAVQGELFYGIKSAVPAFSFKDRTNGIFGKMFDPLFSFTIQKRLEKKNKNLLYKGSSYSNIYTGGATYSNFCAAGFLNPKHNSLLEWLRSVFIITLYPLSLMRIIFLIITEFCVAFYDFATGFYKGKAFFKEIKYIPIRVAICVLIRELITILAKRDLETGLPIIQLNFVGYDEQAHQRGPNSRFARWSLLGIDHSIKRLYEKAKKSNKRNYRLLVYSDHGQERVKSYTELYGQKIDVAIANYMGINLQHEKTDADGILNQRINWLRKRGGYKEESNKSSEDSSVHKVRVAALGPVGHVYGLDNYKKEELKEIAQNFVNDLNIPLVCFSEKPNDVFVITKDFSGYISEVSEKVFGKDHPYYEFLTEDLTALCNSDNSGELILFSWYAGEKPISFSLEKGAHAGFAPNESSAFIFASSNWVKKIKNNSEYNKIRPLNLRNEILRYLV